MIPKGYKFNRPIPKPNLRREDICGKKFNKLTALEKCELRLVGQKAQTPKWFREFKCDCGTIKFYVEASVVSGHSKSCGCKQYEWSHGKSYTRLYLIRKGMINRCIVVKDKAYPHYGGRGIKICNEWLNSVESFYKWALENGYAENLSIDRINNDGDYEPSNCRWATTKEQGNNRRTNVMVEFNGQTKNIAQWSEVLPLKEGTIRTRIRRKGIKELIKLLEENEIKKKNIN